jgi:hypothetical protein
VAFVMAKVALGQVFSDYFGFPCQFSFHRLLHTHHVSSDVVISRFENYLLLFHILHVCEELTVELDLSACKLSDITEKFRNIAMFVTADLRTTFHTLTFCSSHRSYISFHTVQKMYPNNSCMGNFFENLLPFLISGA